MIAIIDCGVGNINAIANMLKKTGKDNVITNDVSEIERASKVILPGVGAFDAVMNELNKLNLLQVLDYKALQQKGSCAWNLSGDAVADKWQRRGPM